MSKTAQGTPEESESGMVHAKFSSTYKDTDPDNWPGMRRVEQQKTEQRETRDFQESRMKEVTDPESESDE